MHTPTTTVAALMLNPRAVHDLRTQTDDMHARSISPPAFDIISPLILPPDRIFWRQIHRYGEKEHATPGCETNTNSQCQKTLKENTRMY